MVDRSALIMPRSNRSGRRSPCLHGVDPRDNSTASRQIPFPIRSPASRWPLGGTGDTARAAEGHSHQPGRCQPGSRAGAGPPHLGRGPARPSDPSVSPSTVRTIRGPQAGWEPLEDLAGRGGRRRAPRLEAISPVLRAEGSTAVRPDGVLAKDRERYCKFMGKFSKTAVRATITIFDPSGNPLSALKAE